MLGLCSTASLLAVVFGFTPASAVRPGEMALAGDWARAKFEGTLEPLPPGPGLEVRANYGVVQRNRRGEAPLRLGAPYTRGLYCHAPSEILVRLPGPGGRFLAAVGVDSNAQTAGGQGSVRFSVRLGEREAYASETLREGMAPVAVSVDLAGADQFTLAVGDAGDGISSDQADWADARVEMADGSVLWLGELELFGRPERPLTTDAPFSFVYDGRPSADLLPGWPLTRERAELDENRTRHTLTWRDPATGLRVRCEGVVYRDFPTVEWTLWLANDGVEDTPILSEIQGLDVALTRAPGGEFVLHRNTGSPCAPVDYQPFSEPLSPNRERTITTAGGRPTNSDMPYFNLEQPGGGVIAAIGWPGQWAATFTRDGDAGLRIRGGQERTHLRLHPGEEIRGPLTVLQFYQGDREHAQNVWRRWMLAHNTPRPQGKPIEPMIGAVSGNHYPGLLCDEAGEMAFLDGIERERIPMDYWWMDAGWYPNPTNAWWGVGTWEVDRTRFPRGIRAIADRVHADGKKLIVWFEPERVHPGTWLYENHPEWLLGADGEVKLVNMGDPAARAWVTDQVDRVLTEEGIDAYRQDFNIDPLGFWRANDAPDRQGMTEIGHVMGYLAFWDELLRRHPGMLIDSCASGGRRNDLETLRRAVPLLRSDFLFQPSANQGHTYGLAAWIPYAGTGLIDYDTYAVRSCSTAWHTLSPDFRRTDLDYDLMRKLLAEWHRVAPYLLGDYYPLTPYSLEPDAWVAWQFDRPDRAAGIVQVFRHEASPFEVARLPMRGLDPEATYTFVDLDSGAKQELTGREAMERGVRLEVMARPGAGLVEYHRTSE